MAEADDQSQQRPKPYADANAGHVGLDYAFAVFIQVTVYANRGRIEIQASSNLTSWTSLTTIIATTNTFRYTNATANLFRFYRAFQP